MKLSNGVSEKRAEIGLTVLIAIVSVALAFGTAKYTSGKELGAVKEKASQAIKTLDERTILVQKVPVIAEQVHNINGKAERLESDVKDIEKTVEILKNEFHDYKLNTIGVHGEQNLKLQRILDKMDK